MTDMDDIKHWVILRWTYDPIGAEVMAVCHSEIDAKDTLDALLEQRATEVNAARIESFEYGGAFRQVAKGKEFKHNYQIRTVA